MCVHVQSCSYTHVTVLSMLFLDVSSICNNKSTSSNSSCSSSGSSSSKNRSRNEAFDNRGGSSSQGSKDSNSIHLKANKQHQSQDLIGFRTKPRRNQIEPALKIHPRALRQATLSWKIHKNNLNANIQRPMYGFEARLSLKTPRHVLNV